MFPLVLIFAVACLVLPLIDIVCNVPGDPIGRRVRFLKIVVIVLTLIWLVFLLFFPGNNAVLFPHVVWSGPTR